MTELRALIFNIQRYSVADGPGIRTTVFLKGCPLRCRWCHNPESVSSKIEASFHEGRCIHCEQCHSFESPEAKAQVCPTLARETIGREIEAEDLMTEILKDQAFFESSLGGVTFSGGEPLRQSAFMRSFMPEVKAKGLHIAIDTCGYGDTEDLLALAPHTDLFLYDVKIMNSQKHQEFTGVDNELILRNLQKLSQAHQNISLRVPIIPGINDDRENMEQIAQMAAEMSGVREVCLLPYHRNAVSKYERLGKKYPTELDGLRSPSSESLKQLAGIFERHGVAAKTGDQ